MTCGGMLEALGILFEKQDFRARTPEKGIAAMDGDAIPVRPALITEIQNAWSFLYPGAGTSGQAIGLVPAYGKKSWLF